ncbi:hypothetical protein G3N56_07850 [Desulfovibrio sulfodismutans]|uniref:Uncharacterized protein n=1 Tax=Desulfolutivibrio sulfodismutans TaxID=63561 RepID=A0A7K3NLJ7_9BACT|nr:hypothetical protein [Desulfolutivibrio sulfodismutans]NDY56655.1 hypothetical protein [Desulfolutivibrio sulfodismutans]QLA11245.1 hypothetical protein GD606_02610 [Desulfolutivibrio sulfodismutans DSM 3696]
MSFLSFDGDMRSFPGLDIYLARGDQSLVDRATRSALASTGYEMSKSHGRQKRGKVPSTPYWEKGLLWYEAERLPKLNPHSLVLSLAMTRAANGLGGGWVHKYVGRGKKKKRLKHFERVGKKRRGTGGGDDTIPFRRVRNSLRYHVHEKDKMVQIGFLQGGSLNWNLSQLIARQADETNIAMSDAMRRFFFAAGFPRRKGGAVKRPARPWFSQTIERNRGEIMDHFRARFFGALERYATGAAKS